MRTLDLKVLRDAVHLRGQLLAVAVLVACGVAVFVMLRSMYGYLRGSQEDYYAEYGFGEVFAHATRAPGPVAERLAGVSGVERLYVRIVRDVILDVPGLAEPATGRLVSLPDHDPPPLNRIHLRTGRRPDPGRRDEILASAAFAAANGLRLGDTFGAVINGRWQRLTVVGTALSPEFIYEISGLGTVFPDNRRFGALWMSRSAMATAFEMEGGFNDVVATLTDGASTREVEMEFDALLEPYGGSGSYARDRHLSHEFVNSEIEETQVTASFFPALFLVITAFLLHTNMLRLVRMERGQIGLMKAFGMDRATIGVHYLKLALIPVTLGAVVGVGLGIWLAFEMAGVYARFYQFPEVGFKLDPSVVAIGLGIAMLTGVAGAGAAVRSVIRLAPAVAMAPPSPPGFRAGLLDRGAVGRALSPVGHMIVRNVARGRWRSLSTAAGIALALGVLTALLSIYDAIDVIADLQFNHAYRDDVAVYFDAPQARTALDEVRRLPGVLEAEHIRVAAARLVSGPRERRVALLGLPPGGELRRIVDEDFRRFRPPVDGVMLARMLATRLQLNVGDSVRVEITEGTRPVADLVVAGIVDELMGGEVYLEAGTLYRLLGERGTVSGAWLRVDDAGRDALYATLKRMPGVASVVVKDVIVEGFENTIEESFTIALTFTLFLGGALVMAIVYNQARVALSERGRELASLRVLGFTRREVARMLLGEQGVLVAAALAPGLALGWAFVLIVLLRFDTEVFRMPAVRDPGTYVAAVGLVLAAAVLSAFLVRRRLDRIDLVAVLKTRE
ncbi:MAG: FtsX-like permease family protein [Gemmatimonadetes bacterium]|nr:FtsX-like permease family protein [Gemmatimonadota bacterium]